MGAAVARLEVVGIGADGWSGLGTAAREAIAAADEVVGSERQLAGLPHDLPVPRRTWPAGLEPLLGELVARTSGTVAILASGDPTHFGIGTTLVRRLGPEAVREGRLRIHPHPSAASLACARMGWAGEEVPVLSTVGRPPEAVLRWAQPGRRLIVYVPGADGAAALARVLCDAGHGDAALTVLERLGGPEERIHPTASAAGWVDRTHDRLACVAVRLVPGVEAADGPGAATAPAWSVVPGLPDAAYRTDGALTKRHVRAATLALLGPLPGERLWDLGAGSGSIAIEWLRAEPSCTAVAVEARADRAERIRANARSLGVPRLEVHEAELPEALERLGGAPQAIFVGGGLGSGLLERAWDRLAPGGRCVANAVTVEGEQLLLGAAERWGGELTRLEISHRRPLGEFTAWRPALPIVQWLAHKPSGTGR